MEGIIPLEKGTLNCKKIEVGIGSGNGDCKEERFAVL